MAEEIKTSLDALVKLCQNFLTNYDSNLASLTSKKNTLEGMITDSNSGLCPSGNTCVQGGCVVNDAGLSGETGPSGEQTGTESPYYPDYSGKYHIQSNWENYVCAQLDGDFGAYIDFRAGCTY